jgi:acid phosphatase family membrane protein YuiD
MRIKEMPWDVLTSPIAIAAFFAWLLAQILKVPFAYWRGQRVSWSLLISPGGMPSSHSSAMTAVTTAIGLDSGWSSPLFVLALTVTFIVVHDATGVRRQAGFHAERINVLVEEIFKAKKWPGEGLKTLSEVIGHSPVEALTGILLGIAIALIVHTLMC